MHRASSTRSEELSFNLETSLSLFLVEWIYEYHTPLFAQLKTEATAKTTIKNVLIQHLLKRINGENIKDEIEIQILDGNMLIFIEKNCFVGAKFLFILIQCCKYLKKIEVKCWKSKCFTFKLSLAFLFKTSLCFSWPVFSKSKAYF